MRGEGAFERPSAVLAGAAAGAHIDIIRGAGLQACDRGGSVGDKFRSAGVHIRVGCHNHDFPGTFVPVRGPRNVDAGGGGVGDNDVRRRLAVGDEVHLYVVNVGVGVVAGVLVADGDVAAHARIVGE